MIVVEVIVSQMSIFAVIISRQQENDSAVITAVYDQLERKQWPKS